MPTEREINIECYSDQRNSSMPDSRRTDKNYNESCRTTSSTCDTKGLISVYCCTFITVSRKLCIAQNSGYTAIGFGHLSDYSFHKLLC